MGFNFSNTCPKIDTNIMDFKMEIEDVVDEIIEEIVPILEGDQRKEIINRYKDSIYSLLEDAFENVRETNSDMRGEAEHQIEELEDEIQYKHQHIQELEEEIYRLNQEVNSLQAEVSTLINS